MPPEPWTSAKSSIETDMAVSYLAANLLSGIGSGRRHDTVPRLAHVAAG
jgi:hypothetical protein